MPDDAFSNGIKDAIARQRTENSESAAKKSSGSFTDDLGKIVRALTAVKPTDPNVSDGPIPRCSEIEAGKKPPGQCYKDSKYTGR